MKKINTKNGRLSLNERFLTLCLAGATVFTLSGCSMKEAKEENQDTRDEIIVTVVYDNNIIGAEKDRVAIKVVDEEDNVIDFWLSEVGDSHIISSLASGDYTITATKIPDGYYLNSDDITVTIDRKEHKTFYDVSFILEKEEIYSNDSSKKNVNKR